MLCYDKTPPSFYESIQHPILITLSKETPPHQFEACKIVASSMNDAHIIEVPGGHMGVVTKSHDVMPYLVDWLL